MTASAIIPSPSMLHLPTLCAGDRVQSDLLIVEREEKTTAAGDPFWILTLGNATGTIKTAPVWNDKRSWTDGADRGAVVQVIGDVAVYKQKRQLTLTAPLRVLPTDTIDASKFLPAVSDTIKLWDWIDKQRAEMKSATLRSVVDLFFADDNFRPRFEQTPGAPKGHHAKVGGLLLHVFEVASIAKATARTMRANVDLVFTGALLHDIGKLDAYEVTPSGFNVTPQGHVLGHIVLGTLMLDRAIGKLPTPICSDDQLLELHHMILSHHGAFEFGSPVLPMTTEARILHSADEASASANNMAESLDDADAFASGGQVSDNKPWRVGNRIWRRPHNWD